MTIKRRKIAVPVALRKIRTTKPTTPKEFRNIGLELRFLKSGLFRETYRVKNCDLVVKMPLVNEKRHHTDSEIRRIKRLSRYRFMRPYLPTVFYHDTVSGTMVMSYHPPFEDHEQQVDALGKLIQTLIYKSTGVCCSDLHSENTHQKKPDKGVVIIDLGY